jgi:hypothetical protein
MGQIVENMSWCSVLCRWHQESTMGAQTGETRQATRDWSIALTEDHIQLCLRCRELILWACHYIPNPSSALEDADE